MNDPIGVFDSGVGGLSVWREIVRQLPAENTLYVADQAHIPYGQRTLDEVRRLTENVTRFLLAQKAKLIVVACNTASGAALHALRKKFPDIPFVGMEPAVKPAVEHTRTGAIGVIATPITFQGDLFAGLVARFGNGVKLHTQACPGLVEAVEAGALDSPETEALLRRYLAPLLDAGIDQLVLGCTHYPFLSQTIQRIVGPDVALIDPAPAVARQVGRVLTQRGLAAPPTQQGQHRFYTSGDAAEFSAIARRLLGGEQLAVTTVSI
ncbi:MAG TPA: glutamate racemase [Anaerolineae bacterium]|nr:glutamate racemase [Anaerolineae bacterium]HQK14053.1 glutamate racemase [Anaerolineae bacterium]